MALLDGEIKATDVSAGRLGGTFRLTEQDVTNLGVALTDARAKAAALRKEFAQSGDDSLLADIRKQESAVKRLEGVIRSAAKDEGGSPLGVSLGAMIGTRAGKGFSDSFEQSLAALPSQVRGTAILAAVGIVSTMAPFLGGAIAGIVVGGAATGGIIGGIFAAAGDPRVTRAWADFAAETLTPQLFGRQAFVEPTILAIQEIQDALQESRPGAVLGPLADDVVVLAEGVGDFVRNIMPGLERAFVRAGPFVDTLASGIGDMGSALGSFLDSVSSSPGAVMALDTTFKTINGTIVFLGKNLKFLADAFGGAVVAASEMSGVVEDIPVLGALAGQWNDVFERIRGSADGSGRAVGDFAAAATRATGGVHSFGEAADLAAQSTGDLATALSEAHTEFLDYLGASIEVEEAFDRFTASVKENGRTLDIDTEAGRENMTALKRIAEASIDATLKKYTETKSVADATAVYEANRKKLYDTAIALGYSKDKAQELVDTLLGLAALPDITKNVTIQYRRITTGSAPPASFGSGILEYDLGGWVDAPKGMPVPAVLHGGEFVLSRDMLAGTQPIPMGAGIPASVNTATSNTYSPEIRVFIGSKEIYDDIRVVVGESNRDLRRRVSTR
jgi:hypothetical protein